MTTQTRTDHRYPFLRPAPYRVHLANGHRLVIDARTAQEATAIATENGHDVLATYRVRSI